MLKKRGDVTHESLWFMFDLVLTVIVFLSTTYMVDNAVESTKFEKNFLARDVSLLLETLYAAPGVVSINYAQEKFWFSFNFDKNKVEVYDANELMPYKGTYTFMRDNNLELKNKLVEPAVKQGKVGTFLTNIMPVSWFVTNKPEKKEGSSANLMFIKTSQEISINSAVNLNKLQCLAIKGSKPTSISILPKTINGQVFDFTDYLKNNLAKSVSETRTKEIVELKEGEEILIIQINPVENNTLKAYVKADSERSKKLACLVLNRLSDKYPNIKPEIQLSTEEILNKAPVSLVLEIGKKMENVENSLEISKAFEEYYG
jgi:hypothetical protein